MSQGFLNPEEIIDQLDLKANMMAAEFGCGSGGFTIYLAKKLSEGLVWAIDILEEPLSALKGRQLMEGLHNIKIVRGDLEKFNGSTIPNSSLDLVVIPNVLFEAEDKLAIMREADRVLKNRGILVIIDWLPEAAHGPEQKVSSKEVKEMAEKLELNFKKEIEAGKYHYGLVFEK
jgi:ubiquinone/menaquinone biosynthesis C-methylase UbiE